MAIRVSQRPRETGLHRRESSIANPAKKLYQTQTPPASVISDEKIKAWLLRDDPENGMFFFNVYKGNEFIRPSLQKAKKFEGHHHISSLLVDAADIKAKPSVPQDDLEDLRRAARELAGTAPGKINKSSLERDFKSRIYKKVKHEAKPRLFCLTTYRCVENQGNMEWHQYFVPFTKGSFCDQPWINMHKKKWVTVDGDLLIHRAEKKLNGEEEKKVELVEEPKSSEYFCMRFVYFIIAIAKKVFAFFLKNRPLPVEKKSSGRGGYSVVLFTTNKRIPPKKAEPKSSEYLLMRIVYFISAIAKKFFSFFLKNKPLPLGLEKKESKVSPNPGVLMATDERVDSYYAKSFTLFPISKELRAKIERIINARRPRSPETQASTPTPTPPVAPPPIQVEDPIEINLEAPGTDQDEDLDY